MAIEDEAEARELWHRLFLLFRQDREAFYELALGEDLSGEDMPVAERPLARLARMARECVWKVWRADARDFETIDGTVRLPVPPDMYDRVKTFILEIDGKTSGWKKGEYYAGKPVSYAEVRFKIRAGWAGHDRRCDYRIQEKA